MKLSKLAVISLLLLGLALAACTRQASTAAVPTSPPSQPTTSAAEDPTMAAVRQTAAVRATEAAVETQAATAQGVGAQDTPTAEATAGAKEVPSETPAAVATQAPAVAAPTAAATPVPTAAPAAGCPNPYVVKNGDWIYKIARQCGMDPKAIIAANPGVNPNFIIPGQKLNMPSGSAAQPTALCTGNYTVVKGDTLFSIAYRCGLTTDQLAAPNGLSFPFVIHPGDVLKFP